MKARVVAASRLSGYNTGLPSIAKGSIAFQSNPSSSARPLTLFIASFCAGRCPPGLKSATTVTGVLPRSYRSTTGTAFRSQALNVESSGGVMAAAFSREPSSLSRLIRVDSALRRTYGRLKAPSHLQHRRYWS